MPDSPKIWGTLELEKQKDWLVKVAPSPLAHTTLTPGRREAGGWPRSNALQSPDAAHQWEINPSIHHINSDSTNTIPPVQHKLNC
jgi:hypothetical protein